MTLPTAKYVRNILDYCPDTGAFTWRARPAEMFKAGKIHSAQCIAKRWNTNYAGRAAGTKTLRGYIAFMVAGKLHYAHRIAWLWINGEWPADQIDHINGDKLDNRISNLRCVSNAENRKNMGLTKVSRSGIVGVIFDPKHGSWRAQINHQNKNIYLGTYDSKEAATLARKSAEKTYGYHSNHGRRKI